MLETRFELSLCTYARKQASTVLDQHYADRRTVLGPAAGMRGGGREEHQEPALVRDSGKWLRGDIKISRGDAAEKCRRSPRGAELWSVQNDRAAEVQKWREQVCLLLLLLLLVDTWVKTSRYLCNWCCRS